MQYMIVSDLDERQVRDSHHAQKPFMLNYVSAEEDPRLVVLNCRVVEIRPKIGGIQATIHCCGFDKVEVGTAVIELPELTLTLPDPKPTEG